MMIAPPRSAYKLAQALPQIGILERGATKGSPYSTLARKKAPRAVAHQKAPHSPMALLSSGSGAAGGEWSAGERSNLSLIHI